MSRVHLSNEIPLADFIVEALPAAASAFFEDVECRVLASRGGGGVLKGCGEGGHYRCGGEEEEGEGVCEFHDDGNLGKKIIGCERDFVIVR